MRFCIKLMFFIVLVLFLNSCIDTCNKGDTFKKINIEKSKFINDDFLVELSTEVLDKLPEKYFKDFYLKKGKTYPFKDGENSYKSLKEIKVNKSRIEIIILNNSLPDLGKEKKYYFYLKFGDRVNYIDCTHPGGPDTYYLKLEMKLKRVGVKSIELSDFKWKEKLKTGAY